MNWMKFGVAAGCLGLTMLLASCSSAPEEKLAATSADTPKTADASKSDSKAAGPQKPGSNLTKTASGLQYEDVVVGKGVSPKEGQTVSVHYTGTLEDGTKFDSSVERGQPFEFTIGVGQVIKGWDEGVLTMKVGGKRRLVIPPDLGYGERAMGDKIPPNSTLHFDVELLEVK